MVRNIIYFLNNFHEIKMKKLRKGIDKVSLIIVHQRSYARHLVLAVDDSVTQSSSAPTTTNRLVHIRLFKTF